MPHSHSQSPTPIFERQALQQGYRFVAGVDEVGRGPLAGPVAAGAVVLGPDLEAPWLARLRDSKALTPRARQRLAPQVQQECLAWSCGWATVTEIDTLGIVAATRLAMRRAAEGLSISPDLLLVDGRPIGDLGRAARFLVRGDATCPSIAAASIVAKVARDSLMEELDGRYPGYGFARNKGYGTGQHLAALQSLGPCPEHRRSFRPLRLSLDGLLARAAEGAYLDEVEASMTDSRVGLGRHGEALARQHLERQGYQILQANYRCPEGEMDLVARQGDQTVFVEVRTRRGQSFGKPEESITPAKKARLLAVAQRYLADQGDTPWRVDVIALELDRRGRLLRLEHYENAVWQE